MEIREEETVYAVKDGKELHYRLYSPVGAACPLFVYFHGGGLKYSSHNDLPDVFREMAKAGVACASVEYRMYPEARFPDYIEDCADAVAVLTKDAKAGKYTEKYIGGSSAGGYLSMMLFADRRYLGARGLAPEDFTGFVFDAGQPTTHFELLRTERGIDPVAVRVDEAAPVYFLDRPFPCPEKLPRLCVLNAESDMTCRREQTETFLCLLRHYGFPEEKLDRRVLAGFTHCGYLDAPAPGGGKLFAQILLSFIQKCK